MESHTVHSQTHTILDITHYIVYHTQTLMERLSDGDLEKREEKGEENDGMGILRGSRQRQTERENKDTYCTADLTASLIQPVSHPIITHTHTQTLTNTHTCTRAHALSVQSMADTSGFSEGNTIKQPTSLLLSGISVVLSLLISLLSLN